MLNEKIYSKDIVNKAISFINSDYGISFNDSNGSNDTNKELEFIDFLISQKIFMVFYERLHDFVSDSTKEICEAYFQKFLTIHQLQVKALKEILTICKRINITPVLVKGIPLSQLIFDSPHARMCADIDILVDEDEMLPLFVSLLKEGFVDKEGFYKDNKLFFPHRWNHHEVFAYKEYDSPSILADSNGTLLNKIYAEIKRGTSAIPNLSMISNFKNCATKIMINDFSCETFNLNYSFLQLLINAYVNSETYLGVYYGSLLKDYLDIRYFLLKFQDEMSWDEIVLLAKSYELTHKIIPVLSNLNDIFPFTVSNELMKKLANSIDYRLELDIPWTITGKTPNEGLLIVDWKENYIQRSLFDKKKSILEYLGYYKRVYYSDKNPYFNQKINLSENSHEEQSFSLVDYRNIIIGTYALLRKNDFLTFEITIDRRQCELDFIIRILFIDNDVNSPIFKRYIILEPSAVGIEIQHKLFTELDEADSQQKKYIIDWQNNPNKLSYRADNGVYNIHYFEDINGIISKSNNLVFMVLEIAYRLNENLLMTTVGNEHFLYF